MSIISLERPTNLQKDRMDKLFLIDSLGYLYRSYYAIRRLTNSEGKSTNALYGFIRSIQKLINDFSPTHLACIFDGPNSLKQRKEIFSEYKSHRQLPPEDLPYQIDWAKEYCSLFGIPLLVIEDVEADDVLGSIAKWAQDIAKEVYICTSDKDLCQLVNDRVFILNVHKDNLILKTDGVKESYGVFPHQIVDFLAITGDSSDNIPGLPGIGPKTAKEILSETKTLDAFLKKPDTVLKGKKLETAIKQKELALLSQKLATLNFDVEFPNDPTFFQLQKPNLDKLKDFYQKMTFRSLFDEISSKKDKIKPQANDVNYVLINDLESLNLLFKQLEAAKTICFDTETSSLNPLEAKLVGIGFGIKDKEAFYIPLNGNIPEEEVLSRLKKLFSNKNLSFFAHNIKYDLHVLKNYDIKVINITFDTILASYLLTPDSHQHSLDNLSLKYFNINKVPIKELIGTGKKAIEMGQVPIEKVKNYCCEDVDMTYRLYPLFKKAIKEKGLSDLLYSLELPLLKILFEMERSGVYIDKSYLKTLSIEINEKLLNIEHEIYSQCDEKFNIKSTKQLAIILFEKLKIPPPKKTKTGYSTNAEVLESIRDYHPIVGKILEFRLLEKLRSTYVDTLIDQVSHKTHRIHCSFNQVVAATGRLSSQNPNLQNIPVRSKEGKQIRKAFCPEKKNWVYLSADYSQLELRILAHLSEDPFLLEAFHNNEDIHASTAAKIFNIPLTQVTNAQRHKAKAVNFGILYGQQAFGLSKQLGIRKQEAQEFIDTYFSQFKRIKDFIEECIRSARDLGYSKTMMGRTRPLLDINSKNANIRSASERLAVNSPIQGAEADIIKKAMIHINKEINQKELQSYMVLQVHDELIFETIESEVDQLTFLVKKGMEGAEILKAPLTVDIKIGKNWKEC